MRKHLWRPTPSPALTLLDSVLKFMQTNAGVSNSAFIRIPYQDVLAWPKVVKINIRRIRTAR